MYKSLRIIFAGSTSFAASHLEWLLSSGYNVVGVLTKYEKASSRYKKKIFNPVKILAQNKNIPIFQPISLSLKKIQQVIYYLNVDIIIVVAYGLIFPKEVLDIPRLGCINVHGSLLPLWRGAAPVQRSILAGDVETGITIIKIDAGIDTGDILYRKSCPISNNDTTVTLYNKLSNIGKRGLVKILQKIINGKITPLIQDKSLVTYAKKISKSEAYINWLLPAAQLERCIRAFNPWPMSWMYLHGIKVKIWQASVMQQKINVEPGTIIKANKKGIQVATIEGVIRLELLQLASKKPISAQDLLNSRPKWLIPGTKLI